MIVALSNSKGGVGKSTIAVHLAVWLAEQGRRVAFVDSDVLSTSSEWLSEAAPDIPLFRLLTPDDVIEQLPKIAAQYEYTIADGPAGLTQVTRAILSIADRAVFPCGPSTADVRGVMKALTALKQIQALRNGLPEAILVPNKLQPQYRLTRELLQIVKTMGMPSGDGLNLRQAYADAIGQGTVVWRMKTQSARAAAGEVQFLFQQLTANDSIPQNNAPSREAAGHSA
jgi:chromosome partitioning protein